MSKKIDWYKSSYTPMDACVEVGRGDGQVHVRDTKDREGPELTFPPQVWAEFLATLK